MLIIAGTLRSGDFGFDLGKVLLERIAFLHLADDGLRKDASGVSSNVTDWSTTNLTSSFGQWRNLGHPTQSPADTYQFTDPQATNQPHRFHRATSLNRVG